MHFAWFQIYLKIFFKIKILWNILKPASPSSFRTKPFAQWHAGSDTGFQIEANYSAFDWLRASSTWLQYENPPKQVAKAAPSYCGWLTPRMNWFRVAKTYFCKKAMLKYAAFLNCNSDLVIDTHRFCSIRTFYILLMICAMFQIPTSTFGYAMTFPFLRHWIPRIAFFETIGTNASLVVPALITIFG